MKKFFKIVTILGAIYILQTWIKALCGLEYPSGSTFTTIGVITLVSLVLWLFYPNQED